MPSFGELPILSASFKAGADLSSVGQDRAVVFDSSGNVILAGAAAAIVGILQNKPKSGQTATVAIEGVEFVVAGAAVAAGDLVTTDANGRAVTATTGNPIFGVAFSAAGAAGALILVHLSGGGKA